jgi:hypothetical protein
MTKKNQIRVEVKIKLLSCNEIVTTVFYVINTEYSEEKIAEILHNRFNNIEILSFEKK